MSRSPDSFYGWHVVFAAFTAQFVASFGTLAGVGAFVTVIEREFATDASTISNAVGASILLMGLLGPLVGRAIDRGNQRAIMLTGVIVMSLGLFATARAQTLWQLGIAFCVFVNLGIVLFGPLPSISLVSRWFVRRRGLAVAIAVAGGTAASAVAPALSAWLIGLESVGWRGAVNSYAIGCAVITLPVFWFFLVKRPEELGQHPDGAATTIDGNTADRGGGVDAYYLSEFTADTVDVTNNTSAGSGGGVYMQYCELAMTDGSVTDNTAGDYGGGVYAYDYYNRDDPLTFTTSTIQRNTASSGGGVYGQYLNGAISDTSDWGEDADDNDPDDVTLYGIDTYTYGDAVSFTCDTTGCTE